MLYETIITENESEKQVLTIVRLRKNGKKLFIVIAVGAVVIKAVRDVIKTKKQEEALKTALDDFYEEELNWWDREHEEGEEL